MQKDSSLISTAAASAWGCKQYLRLDIPVKDLAIMYMFESQTNLHEPVKYLREENTEINETPRI